ncbi:MAG: hypothetical protein CRN43_06695 [Candidatus Nephrothrix sp. EaCA]|nr:MAG: hypothetical protein CRN43_06695 [Candidatus Nephrothrix sp. EaCA]
MKIIHVEISDEEFNKLRLKSDRLTFPDLLEIVRRAPIRQKLEDVVDLSEKCGLSKMKMRDITREVKAVRDGKNSH